MGEQLLRMGLPKGRMEEGVFALLRDAGIEVRSGARNYRPRMSLRGFELKLLKPQNIVEMLDTGSRDLGFAGADWVAEKQVDLVELLDTQLNPVRLVAAAPSNLLEDGKLPQRPLIVASEYENLTRKWIHDQGLDARFVRTYGATEVFPPEDADCIVDNTSTGSTLRSNQLEIVDELMTSSTRLYASPRALESPTLREKIEHLSLLLFSVLEARNRVLLEINVGMAQMEQLLTILPCMREPTIASLHNEQGYAVKVAVLRSALPELIPKIRARGGTDIIISKPVQILP